MTWPTIDLKEGIKGSLSNNNAPLRFNKHERKLIVVWVVQLALQTTSEIFTNHVVEPYTWPSKVGVETRASKHKLVTEIDQSYVEEWTT